MLPISIAFTLLAAIAGQEAAATRPLSSEDLFLRDEQLRAMGRALHTRDMQRRADVPLGYSPYKIDCPSDVTWVRQGDVSPLTALPIGSPLGPFLDLWRDFCD